MKVNFSDISYVVLSDYCYLIEKEKQLHPEISYETWEDTCGTILEKLHFNMSMANSIKTVISSFDLTNISDEHHDDCIDMIAAINDQWVNYIDVLDIFEGDI